MQIERCHEFDLTQEVEQEIADLLATSFPTDFGGRTYYQQRHHVRFLARDAGVLMGHMALCYRDVRLGEALTPIWGLAEVATAPAARGQGVATALLQNAIAFARATPAAFFVLFGDRPIYAGHGFQSQPNVMTYLTLDGARTGTLKTDRHGALMVLPLADRIWDGAAHLDLLGHKF